MMKALTACLLRRWLTSYARSEAVSASPSGVHSETISPHLHALLLQIVIPQHFYKLPYIGLLCCCKFIVNLVKYISLVEGIMLSEYDWSKSNNYIIYIYGSHTVYVYLGSFFSMYTVYFLQFFRTKKCFSLSLNVL